jgi:hypothetical protein
MSDAVRDAITNANGVLLGLLEKLDEVAGLIAKRGEVEASLANVKAAHEKAMAQLAEGQRVLAAAQAEHKGKMAALETAARGASSELGRVVAERDAAVAQRDEARRQHEEILASMQSLRTRVGAW